MDEHGNVAFGVKLFVENIDLDTISVYVEIFGTFLAVSLAERTHVLILVLGFWFTAILIHKSRFLIDRLLRVSLCLFAFFTRKYHFLAG